VIEGVRAFFNQLACAMALLPSPEDAGESADGTNAK
jgi:hypothetical protein